MLKIWRTLPRRKRDGIIGGAIGGAAALAVIVAAALLALTPTPRTNVQGLTTKGLVLHATCDPSASWGDMDPADANLAASEFLGPNVKTNWADQFLQNGSLANNHALQVSASVETSNHWLHISWSTILREVSWKLVLIEYMDGTKSYDWLLPGQTSDSSYLQNDQKVFSVAVFGQDSALPPASCHAEQGASGRQPAAPGATRPLSPIFYSVSILCTFRGQVLGKFRGSGVGGMSTFNRGGM